MEKKIEVIAYCERDFKRYRRFTIRRDYEKGGGIIGVIYIPKAGEEDENLL